MSVSRETLNTRSPLGIATVPGRSARAVVQSGTWASSRGLDAVRVAAALQSSSSRSCLTWGAPRRARRACRRRIDLRKHRAILMVRNEEAVPNPACLAS